VFQIIVLVVEYNLENIFVSIVDYMNAMRIVIFIIAINAVYVVMEM
jgi:hypothetical protein